MSTENDEGFQSLVNIEDIPQVDRLYDLLGFVEDLTFAAESFDRLAQLSDPNQEENHWIERQAFFSAAAIAYSRCFGTGVRGKLATSVLDQLPQDEPGAARKVHKFICDMRDKHIAHSVSPFESVMVAGRVQQQPGQHEPLVAVGWIVMQGLPVGVEAALTCRDIARCLVNYLNGEIEIVQEQVQEVLKKEDPQDFASRPTMSYTIPSPGQAGTSRRFGRGIAP